MDATTTQSTTNFFDSFISTLLPDNEAELLLSSVKESTGHLGNTGSGSATSTDNSALHHHNPIGDYLNPSLELWNDQQITFEIPSNNDLEKINNLDNLTKLFNLFSNSGSSNSNNNINNNYKYPYSIDMKNFNDFDTSGSPVINLGDLGQHHSEIIHSTNNNNNDFENLFFGNSTGINMQNLINYLWIGVVTSLIILSIIFIIFSCYFYRKFKEWKKCNKDIRSQMSTSDVYPGQYGGILCPSRSLEHNYYQVESPPCYTIATGLPTYDEALLHLGSITKNHIFPQNFKFVLVSEQQQQQHQQQQQQLLQDCNIGCNGNSSATTTVKFLYPWQCNNNIINSHHPLATTVPLLSSAENKEIENNNFNVEKLITSESQLTEDDDDNNSHHVVCINMDENLSISLTEEHLQMFQNEQNQLDATTEIQEEQDEEISTNVVIS